MIDYIQTFVKTDNRITDRKAPFRVSELDLVFLVTLVSMFVPSKPFGSFYSLSYMISDSSIIFSIQ